MGKKGVLVTSDDLRRVEQVVEQRREGKSYEDIARQFDMDPWEVREMVGGAYRRMLSESADELRAQVELRLDGVLRQLHADLRLASSQTVRNNIYALILKTEAQRSKLLGLDIPSGTPDMEVH
jgi:uncharacterized protein (DUF433 family)